MATNHPPAFNPTTARLTHPGTFVILGAFVFAIAWVFPKQLYEQLIDDPNYMQYDMHLLAFNASCIVATAFGIYLGLHGTTSRISPSPIATTTLDPYRFTGFSLLLFLTLSNLISVAIFVKLGGFAALRLATQGGALFQAHQREMIEIAGGRLWLTALMLPSICTPLLYQMYRSVHSTPRFRALFVLFVITYTVSVLLSTRRNYIARPLFGVLLIYIAWPTRPISLVGAILRSAVAAIVIVASFLAYTYIRIGLESPDKAIAEIVRYLIAPYNTEALLLSGDLTLPGTGTGFYWTNWAWEFPILDDIFSLTDLRQQLLGDPSPHGAIQRGPIIAHYGIRAGTAFPAFMCSYADFGWIGAFPFALVGWAAGAFWRSFLSGTVAGLLFYPMIAYSFVEWRANLLFPGDTFGYTLIVYLIIQTCCMLETKRH